MIQFTTLLHFLASLSIIIRGDAQKYQGDKVGKYSIGSRQVNGKDCWINKMDAVWFDGKYNKWNIGSKKDIGTSKCGLYSGTTGTETPYDIAAWYYYNGTQFVKSTDILVQKGMYCYYFYTGILTRNGGLQSF